MLLVEVDELLALALSLFYRLQRTCFSRSVQLLLFHWELVVGTPKLHTEVAPLCPQKTRRDCKAATKFHEVCSQ